VSVARDSRFRPQHPLAGKTVILNCQPDPDELNGQRFEVEDWWQNVAGMSWMDAIGNPAALKYAIRSAFSGLPLLSNDVVYGKVGAFGHIIHVSELGEVVRDA
jgi:predicted ATP-dependent serine protease